MSENAIAVEAHGLAKVYRVYANPWHRLLEMVPGMRRKRHREVWALRDVSLRLNRGECLGVLGVNGAGKSTLLKILSGVIRPTHGSLRVHGRVLALLELGSGFNAELTGHQNVLVSANLLGFPADYITERLDQIRNFADIGEYFEYPLKTYSSGMVVRLAMSMYLNMDPDLFIIDEALTVGDLFFQRKCATAIRELRKRGISMLFASHDLAAVQEFCDQVLFLEEGKVIKFGEPTTVITQYFASHAERSWNERPAEFGSARRQVERDLVQAEHARHLIDQIMTGSVVTSQERNGRGGGVIRGMRILDECGRPSKTFVSGAVMRIQAVLHANFSLGEPNFGLQLVDEQDRVVSSIGTSNQEIWFGPMSAEEQVVIAATVKLDLPSGTYRLWVALGETDRFDPGRHVFHDNVNVARIDVLKPHDGDKREGIALLDMSIQAA
jgi:ABC-type polysaccharide/polyol phosphate transport system ATPase subunit